MRKLLHNILICIAVAASALVIGLLMYSPAPDISVLEPLEVVESVPETENEREQEIPVIVEKKSSQEDDAAPKRREVQHAFTEKEQAAPPPKNDDEKIAAPLGIAEKNVKKIEPIRAPPEKKIKKAEPVPQKNTARKTAHPVKKITIKKTVPEVEYDPGWVEDFAPDNNINGEKTVADWSREGGVLFTPKTRFFLREDKHADAQSVLVIESKKSSAVFACDLSGKVDLNKTPVLRWRWRVKKLPPFADGRHRHKDDQAVGIYIGTGNAFNQKSIAYRWETETPAGHWGKTVYSNVMNVFFLSVRNKDDGLNVWYEESRNVRDDFIKKFGFVPDKFAIVICGNSQNSKSEALAEIDYIGFYKEVNKTEKD